MLNRVKLQEDIIRKDAASRENASSDKKNLFDYLDNPEEKSGQTRRNKQIEFKPLSVAISRSANASADQAQTQPPSVAQQT